MMRNIVTATAPYNARRLPRFACADVVLMYGVVALRHVHSFLGRLWWQAVAKAQHLQAQSAEAVARCNRLPLITEQEI